MNAPAALPAGDRRHPRRHLPLHPSASWVVPAVLGVFTGGYAMFLDHTQGSSLPAAALLGLVTAVVVGAACYALGRMPSALMPEVRAVLYGALFGCAFGFLYCLSGATVLRASALGLGLGLVMAVTAFYVFHVHAQQAPPDQARSERTRSERARPVPARLERERSDQPRPDQSRSERERSDQPRPDQSRSERARSDQPRPD
jgi:hypothetical protein